MSILHLADILSDGLADYQQCFRLSSQQRRVCEHILSCRTGRLGWQKWQCDSCGHEEDIGCSCRDRHCPRCQGHATQQWIDKQSAHLLPCPYFHLVFTLPHEFNVLAQYKPNVVYQSLFYSAWQTLKKFANNRRAGSGQLGMTCVLHTWGQNLSQHIHLHCLVPAGTLNTMQNWQAINKSYLFPVKALSKVFKGKYLAALKSKGIDVKRIQVPTKWCVYSKGHIKSGENLVRYLARYTRKGALSESRLLSNTQSKVSFKYKDYRDGKQKAMSLENVEFIRRYLQHVLPRGFMRIRHYGFLANACRKKKVEIIKSQQAQPIQVKQKESKETEVNWPCQACKKGTLKLIGLILTVINKVERHPLLVPT